MRETKNGLIFLIGLSLSVFLVVSAKAATSSVNCVAMPGYTLATFAFCTLTTVTVSDSAATLNFTTFRKDTGGDQGRPPAFWGITGVTRVLIDGSYYCGGNDTGTCTFNNLAVGNHIIQTNWAGVKSGQTINNSNTDTINIGQATLPASTAGLSSPSAGQTVPSGSVINLYASGTNYNNATLSFNNCLVTIPGFTCNTDYYPSVANTLTLINNTNVSQPVNFTLHGYNSGVQSQPSIVTVTVLPASQNLPGTPSGSTTPITPTVPTAPIINVNVSVPPFVTSTPTVINQNVSGGSGGSSSSSSGGGGYFPSYPYSYFGWPYQAYFAGLNYFSSLPLVSLTSPSNGQAVPSGSQVTLYSSGINQTSLNLTYNNCNVIVSGFSCNTGLVPSGTNTFILVNNNAFPQTVTFTLVGVGPSGLSQPSSVTVTVYQAGSAYPAVSSYSSAVLVPLLERARITKFSTSGSLLVEGVPNIHINSGEDIIIEQSLAGPVRLATFGCKYNYGNAIAVRNFTDNKDYCGPLGNGPWINPVADSYRLRITNSSSAVKSTFLTLKVYDGWSGIDVNNNQPADTKYIYARVNPGISPKRSSVLPQRPVSNCNTWIDDGSGRQYYNNCQTDIACCYQTN